ncbi:hypothetical protein A359_03930 [secondary endosymbiont of Ctenarytaina eucalypti]|uniref:Uncharacterized protein n=1 Tax=secondary endosymbiont of Ctenarytaina eucalypti TaxID=1199245 RepID=J3VS28_9ENTR|nr:hypothetical protein A359_03930 [secondary endosymbiont of Ctenarytaina eucalypti]
MKSLRFSTVIITTNLILIINRSITLIVIVVTSNISHSVKIHLAVFKKT